MIGVFSDRYTSPGTCWSVSILACGYKESFPRRGMRPNLPAGWIAPGIHVHEPTVVKSLAIASDAPNKALSWP